MNESPESAGKSFPQSAQEKIIAAVGRARQFIRDPLHQPTPIAAETGERWKIFSGVFEGKEFAAVGRARQCIRDLEKPYVDAVIRQSPATST